MRQIHIAIGFIQQDDKFLLQLRNGEAKIGGAGLIGCFGGKIDDGEDPLVTFCREVLEEASLNPKPHEVKKLGVVNVESDHMLEPVKVTGHVFHWQLKDRTKPKIKEGELVLMTRDEAMANLDKLTTGTRAAFAELL
ncbi:MAG TPA: NUDIX domain-containing protein [Candidatus Saccharimonadales bacterium]|nr:NUDIX domain-containing protein [Candidatus Saccharimonadales bacterium]